ncbi:hypothetical protein [Streptomyces odonnellii]|uniref:hypothetical protein n=1 Tax=Streptomyces odonnellii TaxID=1417980 RepID=UPI00062523D0|nr:hypothetical protein [Streptomyces odonnellii]
MYKSRAPHGAPPGATASGAAPHPAHHVGNALRAVKVFVSTAFRVAVLGEYAEEAGIRRRPTP